MPARYDLHSHSHCSDGALSPGALVDYARVRGVTHLALTDHDTTAGIGAAMDAAYGSGLTVIPGVEISSTWEKRTIHILGLGIETADRALQHGLQQQQQLRNERASRALSGLACSDIKIEHELRSTVEAGLVTRTHIARALVKAGHAASIQKAFNKWLRPGRPGHVESQWPAMAETVRWIRQAGGLAILAHPLRYGLDRGLLDALFSAFKLAGGDGAEVVSGPLDQAKILQCGQLAEKFQLLGSVGSDFHGPDQTWLRLGRCEALPESVQPVWRATWN